MSNSGAIKKRVEDSDFLLKHGRYESAMLLLLTAIDASALKVFPVGTPPISAKKNKKNEMPNWERYQRFLRVRLSQELGFMVGEDSYFGDVPPLVKSDVPLEVLIYSMFRCKDVHESEIPKEYHYLYSEEHASDSVGLSISPEEIVFNKGFLTLLKMIVVNAPCNGKEFGISHFRTLTKSGEKIEDFLKKYSEENDMTFSGCHTLIKVLEMADKEWISKDDDELIPYFTSLVNTKFNGGMITSLVHIHDEPFYIRGVGVTPKFVNAMREIYEFVQVVDIAG
ncbi:TPA: hypothetical protein MHS15_04065 [Klebsiella pneumoniae]|nr:hypothetical protein [Klebsiella pneumoniae]HBX2108899.1 hypothetical protein [Klebsiella pneumoniae]HBX2131005.1 hypothetical protein [Klebsiella pneumoniae]HBX2158283.1 hypothetical protein [Klebsiella pneumoniae]HBX2279312.1 hypothetical protein [Klebsiella pneumoniae]